MSMPIRKLVILALLFMVMAIVLVVVLPQRLAWIPLIPIGGEIAMVIAMLAVAVRERHGR